VGRKAPKWVKSSDGLIIFLLALIEIRLVLEIVTGFRPADITDCLEPRAWLKKVIEAIEDTWS